SLSSSLTLSLTTIAQTVLTPRDPPRAYNLVTQRLGAYEMHARTIAPPPSAVAGDSSTGSSKIAYAKKIDRLKACFSSHFGPLLDLSVRQVKMLHTVQDDPEDAVHVIQRFWRATIKVGSANVETLIAMLELLSDPDICNVEILGSLLNAGLLSFLKERIASPTFLVMQQPDAHPHL
ncbi:hypothetical protein PENSPDRAFT_708044, partial [Peniophora sp. CONT]